MCPHSHPVGEGVLPSPCPATGKGCGKLISLIKGTDTHAAAEARLTLFREVLKIRKVGQRPQAEPEPGAGAADDLAQDVERYLNRQHDEWMNKDGKEKGVCSHYLNGRCTFGEQCRFAHRPLQSGERPSTPNRPLRPNSAPPGSNKSLVRQGGGKG